MCDVYQNAYLTIAAATAHNSSEGLFHPWPFRLRKSLPTASKNGQQVEEVEIFARPFHDEEYVLSRRILRFTAHELVWRCRAVYLCECRPGFHARKESLRFMSLEAMTFGKDPSHAPRILKPFTVWLEIIGPFTNRAITRDTDQLPTVSGVAAVLAPVTKIMRATPNS
ncbi:flavin-containing protein [Fusarium globosum]|uniref:Flavin-containing protein n=1 Tax=Fusarium globosum TaxID=78864 RepID=A0A8H5XXV1_9HYPO|nr:flavin-containing protein [Fusarium globosum]